MRISFKGELAIDTGGVFREMISVFWEVAYAKCCDGDNLLIPLIHPGSDASIFNTLGKVLSHGYLQCGFLPLRIAFPTLAAMLLGTSVRIPNSFLVSSFIESLNSYEQSIVKVGLESKKVFPPGIHTKLVAIISRFGGRELPNPSNLKEILVQLAKYQFLIKPLPATMAINSGIPDTEQPFWQSKTLADIYILYISMSATSEKVIAIVEEPESMNSIEQRIFTYLIQMIGNMKPEEVVTFLRFVSGSSVCLDKKITVSFNDLSGLSRRPIAHTCDCMLELPLSYISYRDFTTEFRSVLSDTQFTWYMNAI